MDNFIWMFTQPAAIRTLINTIIWVLLVPTIATAVGLAYAVFIDKSRGEKYYKVVLFMPIAISFVGAGVIWSFVYEYRSAIASRSASSMRSSSRSAANRCNGCRPTRSTPSSSSS